MSRQSLVKTKSFDVATKYFYLMIELAKVKIIYVSIKYFCVTTEFVLGWGLLCHHKVFLRCNRVWPRQRILGRDRVLFCSDRV